MIYSLELFKGVMFTIKFTIIYDGTFFFGWQRQKDKRTVQGEIEKAFFQLFQQNIVVHGSGRTDRGVHAKGQVGSCTIPKRSLFSLEKSLNALLPKDIAIFNSVEVDEGFHARYSAIGKRYLYTIDTHPIQNPFNRHTAYHHPYPLDVDYMQKAAQVFVGTKDFTSFVNTSCLLTKPNSPCYCEKTIYSIVFTSTKEGFSIDFYGSGFLYKMVRNITGALIDSGEGTVSIERLKEILEKKSNTHGLRQAPAHGLSLEEVFYSQ